LGDPTRREIFERLSERPRAVGELARLLPVSRPAVSQHLGILKEAGLVAERAEGTRRIYRIDPGGLGPLRAWLDRFWADALQRFETEVERTDHGRPHKPKPGKKKRRRPRLP
jgi:DNA-binding transcriptional ArsR family regulator